MRCGYIRACLPCFPGFFALKASATLTLLRVRRMSRICRRGLPLNCGGRTACSAGAVGIYRIWNCKSTFLSFRISSPLHLCALLFTHYSVPFYPSMLDLFSCARLASPSYFMPYMYNSNYSILHSTRHLSLPSFPSSIFTFSHNRASLIFVIFPHIATHILLVDFSFLLVSHIVWLSLFPPRVLTSTGPN
jgi:hypothetical protein